jgi:hypothetical protein
LRRRQKLLPKKIEQREETEKKSCKREWGKMWPSFLMAQRPNPSKIVEDEAITS